MKTNAATEDYLHLIELVLNSQVQGPNVRGATDAVHALRAMLTKYSQDTSTVLAQQLREACASIRTKSYSLSDLIPLLQRSADQLAATSVRIGLYDERNQRLAETLERTQLKWVKLDPNDKSTLPDRNPQEVMCCGFNYNDPTQGRWVEFGLYEDGQFTDARDCDLLTPTHWQYADCWPLPPVSED